MVCLKDLMFMCNICPVGTEGVTFLSKGLLKVHIGKHHTTCKLSAKENRVNFLLKYLFSKCILCDKVIARLHNMVAHVKRCHPTHVTNPETVMVAIMDPQRLEAFNALCLQDNLTEHQVGKNNASVCSPSNQPPEKLSSVQNVPSETVQSSLSKIRTHEPSTRKSDSVIAHTSLSEVSMSQAESHRSSTEHVEIVSTSACNKDVSAEHHVSDRASVSDTTHAKNSENTNENGEKLPELDLDVSIDMVNFLYDGQSPEVTAYVGGQTIEKLLGLSEVVSSVSDPTSVSTTSGLHV